DHASARALRADHRARARGRAGAVAGVTGRFARDVHRGRDAVDGVEERQVQLGLEVVAPLRAGGAAAAAATSPRPAAEAAEDAAEEVAEVAGVVGAEGEATRTAGAAAEASRAAEAARHRAQPTDLVVGRALLGIGEDVVGG